MRPAWMRTHKQWRESARNLVHYVALRQHDLRDLQGRLADLGLSSLGRSESCVLSSVLALSSRVDDHLRSAGKKPVQRDLVPLTDARSRVLSRSTARERLHAHTRAALGELPTGRHISIMVTAPPAKEADTEWMVKMLEAGMNVLRINCAHEDRREWTSLIEALRAARARTGKTCRVLMDLTGPKIRTEIMDGAPCVATWKPSKDQLGRVTAPARVVIRRASAPPSDEATLTVTSHSFAKLRGGDELRFRDARGKRRVLEIARIEGDTITALAKDRAYVRDHVKTRVIRDGARVDRAELAVETSLRAIEVKVGDTLLLTRGRAAHTATAAKHPHERLAIVSCTLPAALDHLAKGQRVSFDDGRIHAVVARVLRGRDEFQLRVVLTQKDTAKLRADKGINLPDTRITIPGLTKEDRDNLSFIARHADAIGLSFVRDPADLRRLHTALDRHRRSPMAVILKIETREAFENLPRLLLEGMRRPPLAVMIARGDLAIQAGFERLAEVQDEILWMCEAAHVPAVWATQVLDTLARTGVPSRAEVTDAAAGVAAECVMLNKGPFIAEAVRALADILGRMERHRDKKRSLFPRLHVSSFGPEQRATPRREVRPTNLHGVKRRR
jgi:pyruvate kinase